MLTEQTGTLLVKQLGPSSCASARQLLYPAPVSAPPTHSGRAAEELVRLPYALAVARHGHAKERLAAGLQLAGGHQRLRARGAWRWRGDVQHVCIAFVYRGNIGRSVQSMCMPRPKRARLFPRPPFIPCYAGPPLPRPVRPPASPRPGSTRPERTAPPCFPHLSPPPLARF